MPCFARVSRAIMVPRHELYETVATRGANAAIVADAGGRILWVNAAFSALSGYALEDVVGRRPGAVLQGEGTDRREVARVREALQRGESTRAELLNYRKDGTLYWVEIDVTALRDASGTLTGFLSNQTDITARIHAEGRLAETSAELDRSYRRLRGVLDNTLQLIGLLTPDGRVVEANRASLAFIGKPMEDVVGRPFWDTPWWTHDAAQQERLREAIRRAARGEVVRFETTHIALDGRIETVDFSLNPVRGADGAVEFIVPEGRLVTEWRRSERMLSRERTRLASILEGTRAGTWEWNIETGETVFNERWAEILGYTLEEISPVSITTWRHYTHEDDLEAARRLLDEHFAGTRPYYELECRMRHKSGAWVWVQTRGKVIERTPDGRPLRMSGTHIDITERRTLELQAMRTQRLEAIGTLAGGIAHDLNNALAPIVMALDELRDETGAHPELVAMLQGSTRRAAEMVRQLLTFAKGAPGNLRPTPAQPLVTEIASMVRGVFPKTIVLEVDEAPEVPALDGDPTQLHQVLLNLCVNARDAMMPGGGTLRLSLREETLTSGPAGAIPSEHARPGRYVVFGVSDTGTGIPSDVLDRVFDPFFTTKGPELGTGLGLSTVLGIVKGHDGFLLVESQPGTGTTFRVYVPVASAVAPATHAGEAPQELPQAPIVVIVDDEPAIRFVARRVLTRLGCVPIVCADAEEAQRALDGREGLVRVVLTDLHMPHVGGLELARRVRARAPSVPIIVASGLFDDDTLTALDALGGIARLEKPFTATTLADALHAAIGEMPPRTR